MEKLSERMTDIKQGTQRSEGQSMPIKPVDLVVEPAKKQIVMQRLEQMETMLQEMKKHAMNKPTKVSYEWKQWEARLTDLHELKSFLGQQFPNADKLSHVTEGTTPDELELIEEDAKARAIQMIIVEDFANTRAEDLESLTEVMEDSVERFKRLTKHSLLENERDEAQNYQKRKNREKHYLELHEAIMSNVDESDLQREIESNPEYSKHLEMLDLCFPRKATHGLEQYYQPIKHWILLKLLTAIFSL